MAQSVEMILQIATHFAEKPILVVCDSWFGNNGLWGPLQQSGQPVHLLSRLRSNTALCAQPEASAQAINLNSAVTPADLAGFL